jgi:hypothetical protein
VGYAVEKSNITRAAAANPRAALLRLRSPPTYPDGGGSACLNINKRQVLHQQDASQVCRLGNGLVGLMRGHGFESADLTFPVPRVGLTA